MGGHKLDLVLDLVPVAATSVISFSITLGSPRFLLIFYFCDITVAMKAADVECLSHLCDAQERKLLETKTVKKNLNLILTSVNSPETGRLQEIYRSYNESHLFHHWMDYAPHYERHLPDPKINKPVRMLEIGVQSGGSTRVWRQYYGSKLHYVGLDVNPKCKRSEVKEEHTYIVTGSQTDTLVMEKICREHGPFDVIVDDGAHSYTTISASLLYGGHLIPTMIKNIFVSIHTYWGIESDTTGHMDPEYAPLQRYITAVHLPLISTSRPSSS
eukprot:gene6832-30806_t